MNTVRYALRLCVTFVLAGAFLGCANHDSTPPDRISLEPHASGNLQAGPHREILARPLRVLVEGPQVRGLLGGKGSRHPIEGLPTTFTVVNPESDARFAENDDTTLITQTNSAGIAAAELRLGRRSTDVYVEAFIETPGGVKSASFRVLAGVEIVGQELEGTTGGTIEAFGVRLTDPDGTPAVGVSVFFTAQESSVASEKVLSDETGLAVTSWKLGTNVGGYFAAVDIRDTRPRREQADRFDVRPIEFRATALNYSQMFIFLLGGLAIFIFGIRSMSHGLQMMADRRLKSILQAVTRNTGLAVAVGAIMTALVQSSSATTVMMVGFVNAGLMNLTQAIGVVLGANIGTTITAQMIAFKLTSLAYPAIIVGLILSMLSKRPGLKAAGEATLGFGLLFLGMMTMSGVLQPLRHSADFREIFQLFDCTPVNGLIPWRAAAMCIVVGTVVTVAVQSSSASIGLVLALCGQGLIPFYSAFPIILGDNIGTTITALLASIGTNRDAKRAALAHTMFNIFGAAYMYILLFVPVWNGQPVFLGFVNWITPGDAFAATPENLPRHVANAHTAFNVLNCILFMPFVGVLAKICERILPIKIEEGDSVLEYLDTKLLASPTVALEQAVKELSYMLRRAQKSVNDGCDLFLDKTKNLDRKIAKREEIIDRLQTEITNFLVQLSQVPLRDSESALIPALIHAVNDAERIGDHSENLVEICELKEQHDHSISDAARDDLRALQHLVNEQCHAIYATLDSSDPDQLTIVMQKEEEINALVKRASDDHVKRLEKGECDVQAGVMFLEFLSNLERVGDRLVNIAERSALVIRVTSS